MSNPKEPKIYDKTIRSLLKGIPTTFLNLLTGKPISKEKIKLLDVKLQKVLEREADLIIEDTETGEIYHVEFQSQNDSSMPVRMATYFYLILQNYGRAPKQYLIFVGEEELTMPDRIEIGSSHHSYKILDLKRDIDCSKLLESENPSDWLISILCWLDDGGRTIRKIISKIASIKNQREKQELIQKLLILAGLRKKKVLNLLEKEVRTMGLVIDPETNVYLMEIKEKGKKEGELLAKKEVAKNLYRKLGLSPEQIAEILEVSVSFVKEAVGGIEGR